MLMLFLYVRTSSTNNDCVRPSEAFGSISSYRLSVNDNCATRLDGAFQPYPAIAIRPSAAESAASRIRQRPPPHITVERDGFERPSWVFSYREHGACRKSSTFS